MGAHVSTAGGLDRVPDRIRRLGAEAAQVFASNPRQWPRDLPDPARCRVLGAALAGASVPLFVHAIYLVNLATPDPVLAERSAAALAHAWAFGAWAGARGVVVHPGVRRQESVEAAEARVAVAVARAQQLAAEAGPLPPLLVETSAGSRNALASTPEALGRLLALLPPPAALCLDTAHAFAAGHPVHTAAGLGTFLGEVERWAGPGAVGLVHLNDSRTPLGSGADRHENLGQGLLGRDGLGRWFARPELRRVPFVLETPGFRGEGPDLRNLRVARVLRARAAHGEGVGASGE